MMAHCDCPVCRADRFVRDLFLSLAVFAAITAAILGWIVVLGVPPQ